MSARSKPYERVLRQRIAGLIDEGRLPLILQTEVTAGPGSGSLCPACGRLMSFAQAEYEAEYALEGGSHRLNLHRACYVIWQSECRKRIAPRGRVSREARRV
jgi:hypothetical protein